MANFHSIGGNEVEAHYAGGDLLDDIEAKAYSDGYYAQLTAGAADNLTGRGDATGGEYLFRTTAGTASVSDEGVATVKSIRGRTLRWNQLVTVPFMDGETQRGITFTANSDGTVSLSGTCTQTIYKNLGSKSVAGHTYLVRKGGTLATDATLALYNDGGGITVNSQGSAIATANAEKYFFFRVASNATIDGTVLPQIFDLTAMFGEGNEPSTVAEFEALYPLPYYAYDAGTLLPVRMTGIETTGFNQFDGTHRTEVKYPLYSSASVREMDESYVYQGITSSNIGGQSNVSYMRSPSGGYVVTATSNGYGLGLPVPVFPSTGYYVRHASATGVIGIGYYTESGTYISGAGGSSAAFGFTTPANCRWAMIILRPAANTPTTYDDICINLSWSGYRDGEYEAYWSEQRVIAAIAENFPDGMRSAGSVADELTETAAIHRVGAVDLGTLTWTYSNGFFRTSDLNSVILRPANNSTPADAKCSKYEIASWNSETDKSVMVGKDTSNPLLVKDTAYTDPAAFKTAMSGVMLHYALATPTTVEIDPPLNTDYRYSDFGTERILVPTGEQSAPPTLETVYGINATDTIRNLPTDYTGKKSLENLLAALDAHNGTTTTMTWNEGQQAYTFAIADNE